MYQFLSLIILNYKIWFVIIMQLLLKYFLHVFSSIDRRFFSLNEMGVVIDKLCF